MTPNTRREKRDISAIFDEIDKNPTHQITQVEQDSKVSPLEQPEENIQDNPTEQLHMENGYKHLEELEKYLSPDLWRKLNSNFPRKGVYINALVSLNSILELIATYLPRHIVQAKIRKSVPGLVTGELLNGTFLFADVSGFTSLTEKLAGKGREGAEILTNLINNYFTSMLKILAWSGGILTKFAGDAILVYFPEQKEGRQVRWAIRIAFRMMQAMEEINTTDTPVGLINLKIKIGIGTGSFLSANIGSRNRMEYITLGQAIIETMTAESVNTKPGQIIINEKCLKFIDDEFIIKEHSPGFYLVENSKISNLDDFEIKTENRRSRGNIALDGDPRMIQVQMEVVLRQIQALEPYLPLEIAHRTIEHARFHERKLDPDFLLTTVIFMNLIGSESLLEQWGSQGIHRITAILSSYFNTIQNIVFQYGGIITRIDPYSKGQKILIIFGAPVTHEDDVQRAVNAALTIKLELEKLNKRLIEKYTRYLPPNFDGELLHYRMGITQGIAFAGQVGDSSRREYTVMGDDVNLSARLMSSANYGQILVSQHVEESVGSEIICSALTPISVKGKSQLIPIYQVDGLNDDLLTDRINKHINIIGREEELQLAFEIVNRMVKEAGGILIVQGPAGIGKSHLVDIIINQAKTVGVKAKYTECHSYMVKTPYAIWKSILRKLAGISFLDYPMVCVEKIQKIINQYTLQDITANQIASFIGIRDVPKIKPQEGIPEYMGEKSDLVKNNNDELSGIFKISTRRKRQVGGLDDYDDHSTVWGNQIIEDPHHAGSFSGVIYNLFYQLFEKMQVEDPTILFFEDAHWMDTFSRDLLLDLAKQLKEKRVLFIIAQRDELVWDNSSEDINIIKLGPFNKKSTEALVSDILLPELIKVIQDQSNGNPLYIEEICHWLRETGKIGTADLILLMQSSDIYQKLVLSSLETLSEGARETIRAASIIGNDFRIGEVSGLLEQQMDAVSISNYLTELVANKLIYFCEFGVDARYEFRKNHVRDVIYNSLSFEKRRGYHNRFANYLSAPKEDRRELHKRISALLAPEEIVDQSIQSEIIAFHFHQGQEWRLAGLYYMEAGVAATVSGDLNRALRFFTSGLDVLGNIQNDDITLPNKELFISLHLNQGDAYLLKGEYQRAGFEYDSVNKYIQQLPLESMDLWLSRLWMRQTMLFVATGRVAAAFIHVTNLMTVLTDQNNPLLTILQLWVNWRMGNKTIKDLLTASWERLTGIDDWTTGVTAFLYELEGQYTKAIQIYQRFNITKGLLISLVGIGDQKLLESEYEEAREYYQSAWDVSNQVSKDLFGQAYCRYKRAYSYFLQDEKDSCINMLNEVNKLLLKCPAEIRKDAVSVVNHVFEKIQKGNTPEWDDRGWQIYDDSFRITIFYNRDLLWKI